MRMDEFVEISHNHYLHNIDYHIEEIDSENSKYLLNTMAQQEANNLPTVLNHLHEILKWKLLMKLIQT